MLLNCASIALGKKGVPLEVGVKLVANVGEIVGVKEIVGVILIDGVIEMVAVGVRDGLGLKMENATGSP